MLHRGRREALGVEVELVDAALDQAPRVGLVVDRELARVAQARRLGAQHARARGVEGHDPHAARGGPSSSSTRSRISCAALLVKVMARISPARARPVCTSQAMRWVSTRVLPEPAPARMSSGPSPWRHRLALGLVEPLEEGVEAVVGGGVGHDTLSIRPRAATHPLSARQPAGAAVWRAAKPPRGHGPRDRRPIDCRRATARGSPLPL